MVDECVSVLLCYRWMGSGFSIINSSATLRTRYAQHVRSDSYTKGSFLPSPTPCCSLPLARGLLGILQHNASHTEQPPIDPSKGFPLLVTKQHCRSAPWLWFHPFKTKLCLCFFFQNIIPAPSNTEKKPHINGHASPSHLAANLSNNHAGKQSKSQCLLLFSRVFFQLCFF